MIIIKQADRMPLLASDIEKKHSHICVAYNTIIAEGFISASHCAHIIKFLSCLNKYFPLGEVKANNQTLLLLCSSTHQISKM